MNLLIDRLPTTVTIDEAEYEINSDFRFSILFELLMLDEELEITEKVNGMLDLYYPVLPHDLEIAVEAASWFYRGGHEEERQGRSPRPGRTQRIYSFDYDDGYIYAAFLQQYGIDLNEVEYLHWWKFKAMFQSITNDCEIRKIMGYRGADTSKLSKEQKEFYNTMKELYRIPVAKNERQKMSAIENALRSGGDVSELL